MEVTDRRDRQIFIPLDNISYIFLSSVGYCTVVLKTANTIIETNLSYKTVYERYCATIQEKVK